MLFILKFVCCHTVHIWADTNTLRQVVMQRSSELCCFQSFTKINLYWKVGLGSRIRFEQNLQNKVFSRAAIQLTLFLQTLTKEMVLCCLQSSAAPQASCCADGWTDLVGCRSHRLYRCCKSHRKQRSGYVLLPTGAQDHGAAPTGWGRRLPAEYLEPGTMNGGNNSYRQAGVRIK